MEFLDLVQPHIPARHHTVLVAARRGGEGEHVTLGAAEDSTAEIGSLSKGITGLLLHDAIARGEVLMDTTLGETLGLVGALAPVTLGEIAIHRSGIPPQPGSMGERTLVSRTWRMWTRGTNPYGDTVSELITQAEATKRGEPKTAYSNLGFELLGAALAARAVTPYPELVAERIVAPLGLTGTSVPRSPEELGPLALLGSSKRGRPHEAWTGEALGPAGGIRMNAHDLDRLLAALLDGSAPGIGALDPVADMGHGSRIGAAWITLASRGREVTWHNGRTGGFATWLGVDREAGTGVALVSATAASLDRAGFDALHAITS